MAHIGKVEQALPTCTAHVFQASKPRLEIRRHCIRAWTGILGTEIKAVSMPFGVNINNVVPLCLLGWGFNVLRLQNSVYQFCCFRPNFRPDGIRHFGLGWAVNPYLLSHQILKVNPRPFNSHPICYLQTKRNSHSITDDSLIFYYLISSPLMEVQILSCRIHAGHVQKYRRNSRQCHL
jgi:hypothetical protein